MPDALVGGFVARCVRLQGESARVENVTAVGCGQDAIDVNGQAVRTANRESRSPAKPRQASLARRPSGSQPLPDCAIRNPGPDSVGADIVAEWQGFQVFDNLGAPLTRDVHDTLTKSSGPLSDLDWFAATGTSELAGARVTTPALIHRLISLHLAGIP